MVQWTFLYINIYNVSQLFPLGRLFLKLNDLVKLSLSFKIYTTKHFSGRAYPCIFIIVLVSMSLSFYLLALAINVFLKYMSFWYKKDIFYYQIILFIYFIWVITELTMLYHSLFLKWQKSILTSEKSATRNHTSLITVTYLAGSLGLLNTILCHLHNFHYFIFVSCC